MKLPIKKIYFDMIKSGAKKREFRDAHITFINEETGETLVKVVKSCKVLRRPSNLYPDVLSDKDMIVFEFDNLTPKGKQ